MKRSKEMAIYLRLNVVIREGKFAREIREEEVRVLARAEGWAMVRVTGGNTFAVPEKELRAVSAAPQEGA